MEPAKLLDILSVAEKLKCNTRHSYTSSGRKESVAEHSWRLALMALLLRDEFPGTDMDRVIRMCLIHDLGEAFTGDIPAFEKRECDGRREEELLEEWVGGFPSPCGEELLALLREMDAQETMEARVYKALDNLEAVIQHDEADISTWLPLEYELNQTYAQDRVQFSEYLTRLRQLLREETQEKIARG